MYIYMCVYKYMYVYIYTHTHTLRVQSFDPLSPNYNALQIHLNPLHEFYRNTGETKNYWSSLLFRFAPNNV